MRGETFLTCCLTLLCSVMQWWRGSLSIGASDWRRDVHFPLISIGIRIFFFFFHFYCSMLQLHCIFIGGAKFAMKSTWIFRIMRIVKSIRSLWTYIGGSIPADIVAYRRICNTMAVKPWTLHALSCLLYFSPPLLIHAFWTRWMLFWEALVKGGKSYIWGHSQRIKLVVVVCAPIGWCPTIWCSATTWRRL